MIFVIFMPNLPFENKKRTFQTFILIFGSFVWKISLDYLIRQKLTFLRSNIFII